MKRRNFLKGFLGSIIGVTVCPSVLKAATQKDKPVWEWQWEPKDGIVYMGLLYNGKEITGKGYYRIKTTKKWGLQTDSTIINIEEMQFPRAGNDWGYIDGLCFYTTKKNGYRLLSGKFDYKVYIRSGDIASFPSQYIEVGL